MTQHEAGALGRELVASMTDITWNRHGELALNNARRNRAFLDQGQSLAALRGQTVGVDDSAIIIAAGPSIARRDPAKDILAAGYQGAIVTTESAIPYCLRNGITPDLVVTLDPHTTRIVRWFGDPNLTEDRMNADDYYRRQDMDTTLANEQRTNEELLALFEKHGRGMRIALSTTASQAVVDRVLEIGMDIYWWNPMLDDPDLPDGRTREIYALNRLPCVNAGGNVGAACWMMASAVLEKSAVALTGMDFSYYADTPYDKTQYYHESVALVGEDNLDSLYMRLENPHLGATFYTDPAYMWYRENFLEMAAEADCKTYNCTEGGILFGDPIEFVPLREFLDQYARRAGTS